MTEKVKRPKKGKSPEPKNSLAKSRALNNIALLVQTAPLGGGNLPFRGEWVFYILRCRDGSLYTGISNDLERRIIQHSKGIASRYTRSRLPVKLVFFKQTGTKSSALKAEIIVKNLSRTEKLRLIEENQN